MGRIGKTLVLAGAREAHGIVNGLLGRGRDVVASLPEPERMFGDLPVKTRLGAFGDVAEFRLWLSENEVTTVIDASHAFDDKISQMAQLAATSRNLRYLRVLRPPWVASMQDQWIVCSTVRQAVETVGPGLDVFSNTGWGSLPDYAGFRGRTVYFRQTHPVTQPAPYHFVKFISGTPPFSQRMEETLFRELGISRLICRNVGGAASMSKLLAARKLGIRVLMVQRPPVPPAVTVAASVAEALAWEADP